MFLILFPTSVYYSFCLPLSLASPATPSITSSARVLIVSQRTSHEETQGALCTLWSCLFLNERALVSRGDLSTKATECDDSP